MDKYELGFYDFFNGKCKNFQRLNTIEIFYYISTRNSFIINYKFHPIDIKLCKSMIGCHTEYVRDWILTDMFNENIENIELIDINKSYYEFNLESKDANLYRNINLIPYLCIHENDEIIWSNCEEQIKLNTWNIK